MTVMLRGSFVTTSAAGIILAASALAFAQTRTTTPLKTGYAPVNGLKLYYEIHGAGEPLILLHGGVGATEMFDAILPQLSNTRRVIAVDLQAHGRTAHIDRPLSLEAIKAPALLVFGDADAVRTAHAVQFFELLGGGKKDAGWDGSGMSNARLAILPGLTHYDVFSSPLLASTVTPFLDAPIPARK